MKNSKINVRADLGGLNSGITRKTCRKVGNGKLEAERVDSGRGGGQNYINA
jgi:hypothetical protein